MTENGRFLLFKPVYKGLLSQMFEVSVTKSQSHTGDETLESNQNKTVDVLDMLHIPL